MKVSVVAQVGGKDSHAAVLNRLLRDRQFHRFRALIAFARQSGIAHINESLTRFAARAAVDVIVGIDLGGTTHEALKYLCDLPNARVRVATFGRAEVVFHPKVYIFDGPAGWATVIGSSNLTGGGLHSNAEASLLVTGTAQEANPFEKTWKQFNDPVTPVLPAHLHTVTPALLNQLSKVLAAPGSVLPDSSQPTIEVPPLALVKEPANAKRGAAKKAVAPLSTYTSELYMELWDETGGGTQVQISKDACLKFFGGGRSATTYVTLHTPSGTERLPIQEFPNSTWRIRLGFVERYPTPGRRAVLRFRRRPSGDYDVEIRTHSSAEYNAWLASCTTRRGQGKRYGIYP